MGYYCAYRRLDTKEKGAHVCFSRQFSELFDFDLFIYTNKNLQESAGLDHNVILSNKDVNLFIRTIKKEFGGITRNINRIHKQITTGGLISCKPEENLKVKEVRIEFNECKDSNTISKETVYKIICTYLRYLYEEDFTYILKNAINAYRKNKRIHLFTYLYNAHKDHYYNVGHSIIGYLDYEKYSKFFSLNETDELDFENTDTSRVQNISKIHRNNSNINLKQRDLIKNLLK